MTESTTRLPEPWDSWVLEMLGSALPGESFADCGNCAMCTGRQGLPAQLYFDSTTRCCTYRPRLSNFMAGMLLLSEDPDSEFGRNSLAERIDMGEAGLLGVMTGPAYQAIYGQARDVAFGRASSLRCPHQADDANCGIHKFRPPVCFTWYCKYERAAVGQALWRGVYETLSLAEHAVSLWCLEKMGIHARRGIAALGELNPSFSAARLDHRRDEPGERETWGGWYGREAEFYAQCARHAAGLEWNEVLGIGGQELALRAEHARDLARRHEDSSLPRALRAGEFQVTNTREGKAWLVAYNAYDPLEVDPDLVTFIARCDGRDLESIIAGHLASGGRRPDRILLRTLLDMGILEPDQ
ncbi:MAG: hypothetical protein V2I48_14915 [Xanthomonadales bacterium]|jgi:hypothetical protein|nr:hypothetical protein [Xanthomonadales bacterium]